jgi:hypothetical protein
MMAAATGPSDRSGAVLSPCGTWRYRLTRRWGDAPLALFVMLNPSTADAEIDDPTIRKCVGFARRWGMGGVVVGNLFAFRATRPADMLAAADPVGPDNRAWLEEMAAGAAASGGIVVCAWGANGKHMDQDAAVLGWLEAAGVRPTALRVNKDGTPMHPLYVPYETVPSPYGGRAQA